MPRNDAVRDAGRWDPTLAVVMLAAMTIHAIGFHVAMRRGRPVLAAAFALPTRKDIDARLVGGAFTFGVGWGLAGLCPGPAITSLATGDAGAFLFVAAMLVGMVAGRRAGAALRYANDVIRQPARAREASVASCE